MRRMPKESPKDRICHGEGSSALLLSRYSLGCSFPCWWHSIQRITTDRLHGGLWRSRKASIGRKLMHCASAPGASKRVCSATGQDRWISIGSPVSISGSNGGKLVYCINRKVCIPRAMILQPQVSKERPSVPKETGIIKCLQGHGRQPELPRKPLEAQCIQIPHAMW